MAENDSSGDDNSLNNCKNLDINAFINKYINLNNNNENPLDNVPMECNYYDVNNIKPTSDGYRYQYTSMHINIHSLPAKFDSLKLILSILQNNNIQLDFILICERFLPDENAHLYHINGYNFI
jgi:hypothetical protein